MENHTQHHHLNRSRWVAVTAIMSSLALVGNYALVMVPNVELGSTVLFVTAFLFGLQMAAWCVFLVSIIFAVFNPWGPFIPAIWLAQVIGWLFMVTAGWMMGRTREKQWTRTGISELSFVGAIATLFFDLVTTMAYSWALSVPFALALISGLPFMLVHIFSNAIIFPLVIPKLDTALKRQIRHLIRPEISGSIE